MSFIYKIKTIRTALCGIACCIMQTITAGNQEQSINKNNVDKPFRMPSGIKATDYVSDAIIFKLKPQHRNSITNASLQSLFNELQVNSVEKIYPLVEPPLNARNSYGEELVDLSLIYELHFKSGIKLESAINKIIASGLVQYAEPRYIFHEHKSKPTINDITNALAAYNPNDPDLTNGNSSGMYYINKIKCPDAWGINTTTARGDTATVIGIVDSGTDIDHPELISKIKYNYKDPINGIDDDGDGYIDNFRGWDISDNDNNPNVDNSNHGSHVSGCAAAATDNGIGVASPGFKCTFLPVKCSKKTSTSQIDNGYEGIQYAAAHGCQIINCSWGGSWGGQYGLDIITYATINKGALVVASAGNGDDEVLNFPGSYDLVLCVASTDNADKKSSFSTYNHTVDVSAPGTNIRSTIYDNSYGLLSGTSMASPICAGAAAIVKTFYPNYTGLQVGEQLRVTSDDIYSINSGYKEKLGKGRINLYRALTETPPSVRMRPVEFDDNNDNVFVINDTIYITGKIVNYLTASTNLTATLSTTNTNVTIINPSLTIGAMATMASFDVNKSTAYKVFIKPGTPVNSLIPFTLTFKDGSYTDYQYFDLTVNVDYININVNDVGSTNTSRGRIGWNNNDATGGLGFTYKDSALLYEAGLMIGISSSKVSDNVRGNAANAYDTDFVSVSNVKNLIPSVKAEYETIGMFNDNGANDKIGVQVKHKTYAWTTQGDKKYIIFEYIIKNTNSSSLSNLYAGIEADWDITDKTAGNNKGNTDQTNKLGYAYSILGSKFYAGIRLLTKGPFLHYVIDNVSGGGGGVDITDKNDYYSTSKKYTTLSTNRLTGGNTTTDGNDILSVVSSGPFTIAANDSITVAFAIIAGDSLADLVESSINAQTKYDNVVLSINDESKSNATSSLRNYPNPSNGTTTIEFYLSEPELVNLVMYNSVGQKVATIVDNIKLNEGWHKQEIDVSKLNNGIYFYQLTTKTQHDIIKSIIQNLR